MDRRPQFTNADYTAGWLCALVKSELTAARKMLDREHKDPVNLNKADGNAYFFGDIAGHNVVNCMHAPRTARQSLRSKARATAQTELSQHGHTSIRWHRRWNPSQSPIQGSQRRHSSRRLSWWAGRNRPASRRLFTMSTEGTTMRAKSSYLARWTNQIVGCWARWARL